MSHRLLVNAMSSWGRRYGMVGAFIGLILPFFTSATLGGLVINLVLTPIYGMLIGAIIGSLGGAYYHWIKSKEQR